MIIDARRIDRDAALRCDLCIVGAGIAGLTLASALEGSGLDIVLLESGGRRPGGPADSLNAGSSDTGAETPGLGPYPMRGARTRGLGGTSALWTGVCIALDPTDFAPRSWVPHSGWPIDAGDLVPHLERARPILGLAEGDPLIGRLRATRFATDRVVPKTLIYAGTPRLGRARARSLARARRVRCILNATVLRLVPDALVTRIEEIVAADPDGRALRIRPRAVVLATGGIENARLLLASTDRTPRGIGNDHGLVGTHFMEHPIPVVGVLPLGRHAREARLYTDRMRMAGVEMHGTLGLSAATRAEADLLDMHLRFYRYATLEALPAVIEGKAVARTRRAGTALAYLIRRRREIAAPLASYLSWHLANKLWRGARFDHVRVMALLEQEPDPDNRIRLSDRRDRFGTPLPHLDFRLSGRMRDSVARSLAIFREEFLAQGFGRLAFDEAEIAHLRAYDAFGLHPMGATRMATDPRRGVVDADCRVHGLANLFVVGSSVFPTGGAANPSWTIAALALRLAERLPLFLRAG